MIHVSPPSAIEMFIAEKIAEVRASRYGANVVTPHPGGYSLNGRPYVALRCDCPAKGCPGYIMVHDEPSARAYFEKLFQRRPG